LIVCDWNSKYVTVSVVTVEGKAKAVTVPQVIDEDEFSELISQKLWEIIKPEEIPFTWTVRLHEGETIKLLKRGTKKRCKGISPRLRGDEGWDPVEQEIEALAGQGVDDCAEDDLEVNSSDRYMPRKAMPFRLQIALPRTWLECGQRWKGKPVSRAGASR
jgi:hypothetical protein